MPKKESSNKAREWERDRRERLNETFNLLSTLLPSYDPSITRSKIEILQKAVAYISDLQKENKELVKGDKDQACWKQVRQLKHRMENLLRRVQQLTRLLHDAGISVPPELPKDGQPPLRGRPPKWSNKIRQEDATALLEKVKSSKSKRANKKKERAPLNACGNKIIPNEPKAAVIVSTVSESSNIKTVSTTSKTKLGKVTKITKVSKGRGKKSDIVRKSGCEELPTVTQLLGLSLNDIDVAPTVVPPPQLSGSGELMSSHLNGVTPNTAGTNVTVLASNIPQVPQGFIVIPKGNSLPTTSKAHLPQSQCIVVAPASQAVTCSQQNQQPCVVMPSKVQATKVIKTSMPIQQPIPMVLSSTTSALENVANPTVQKSDSAVAVTNSHLLTTPIMATGMQTCSTPTLLPTQGASLTGLGPGTLILANGSILPIFPSSQPASAVPRVLTPRNSTQIVMNSGSNIPAQVLPNQSVLLVQNKAHSTSDVSTSNAKPRRIYSLCLPKPLKRKGVDSTRTNKVPISALTSRSQLIRSIATSAQVPVSKHANRIGDTRSSKRISDKKSNSIQKGNGRNSKANAKIQNKNKITIVEENIENNLQTCVEKNKAVESGISEIASINSTAKENVDEHVNNNVAEPQINCAITREILNNISPVDQKCKKEDLNVRDCYNKRTRDVNEDTTTKCSKQVKYSHKKDDAVNTQSGSSEQTSFSTSNIANPDSFTSTPVDGQTKKTNEESVKAYGGNDYYSIDSICKSNEKVEHTTDTTISSLDTSEKNINTETSASFQSKENGDSSVVSNDKAISCDANKLCSAESYTNLPSTMTSVACMKGDSMPNEQLTNSSNDFNATSCSPGNPLTCPSIRQSEAAKESNQDICNSAIYNGSKNMVGDISNNLKSSSNNENCNITSIASVRKSSQTLEESSMSNNVFQQETSVRYSQPVSAEVPLFSPKAQNDISESEAPGKTTVQTEFGSENAHKIQNDISEHSLHNNTSHLSNGIANEQSPTTVVRVSDIQFSKSNCSVQLESCKVDNRDNIDTSENIKEIEKSPKNDFSGSSNVQSELSSTEYNTFSSVSEGNVSACSSANKIFRSNENLDLGASATSSLCLSLQNNELSNDLFASLQVPSGGQHAESISPTAAFLLAFPLVSTSKVSDIIGDSQDDVGSDSLQGTSTLLQIGSLDSDHHSEAIISRSPTFQSANNSSKILPQPTLCQKESRVEHQELECQQFLSSSSKIDRNSEKIKVDHIKFSDSLDETEKISNKNWISLQTPSHSETISKTDIDESRERNLDAQTFTKECLDSQMKNREMTGDCTKEKALEESCTFNATKEMRNVDCSSRSLNAESSQQTSSNVPPFSERQFVAPIYNSKEHSRLTSIKQDQTPQNSSALQITPDRSINFVNPSTSKDEERNFRSAYKNLALNSSNSATTSSSGVSFPMGKNVSEQATMTEDERTSHSNSLESSNKIKQTSFSSADCSGYSTTSQSGYMLSNIVENEKCSIPSFSVAHNSSNFSILSWTTLSPTSTMTNTSQYDGFGTPNSVAASQNNYLSVPKKQNKNICSAEVCPVMTSSSVPETCQPQMKETLSSHTINKFSESNSSSLLQNSNNQNYLQHFLPDQRKMVTSVAPSSIDNTASQGPQLCATGKVPESEQQHRPPVNWMTTPDVRGGQHSMNLIPSNSVVNRAIPSNSATVSGASVNAVTSKDNQYCSISSSQNVFISCISSTLPTFDTRTYTSNTFYGTQSVSSQNSQGNCYQSGTHGQGLTEDSNPNSKQLHFTSSLNRLTDVHMGQTQLNETYSVPWLQKKPNPSSVCSTESSSSNFISSSLPTLVGDLALGTNYPLSVNDDEQGSKGLSSSVNFHPKMTEKKSNVCNSGNNSLEEDQSKQIPTVSKNNDHNKDRGAIKTSVQEFRTNSSQSSGSSFLSVSQLVNQAHPCENSTREHTISRESSHISNRVLLPNKNTNHSQSHQITNLSSTLEEPKEQISSLSSSEKEMNRKPRPEIDQSCVSIRSFESRISLSHSREEEARRKIETSQVRGSNHYIQEITSNITPALNSSNSNSTFSITSSTQATSTLSSVSWSSGNVVKQRSAKGSSSGCKAPASSYSAEALIGLNSQVTDRGLGTMSDSRVNKVITLPPPVVSERFCRHQNYPPASTARPIQVPPPFSTDTILPSNYFTSMELQTSHQDGSSSTSQNVNNSQSNLTSHSHQNQQGFNTFPASSSQSAVRASNGQCNSVLYSHSDFMSSVGSAHPSHSLPPVSLPCNFLPDLGSNNSYTSGILSDSGNPFLFPSSSIPVSRGSSACHSMGGGKQSLTHLHSSTQVTTGAGISEGHETSNQIVPTLPLGDKEPYSGNSLRCNTGSSTTRRPVTSEANMLQQNTVEGGTISSSSKQRIKKRTSEPATHSSSTGLGGLMDLGYLGIPPVIGSPMLPDEGTFINHSGGFLAPNSQHTTPSLYPGAPTPSQGSFYPTTSSHGQSNASHASHLPVNSAGFTTQTTRGLQLGNMVSPSVVNSSGTSLTNFNLSTIFPEINEKQVPNNAYNSSVSKESGPLLSSSMPTTAPRPPHSQLNNSTSNHNRQPATLLLPPVSSYAHRQTSGEGSICLPPPPPPPPPVPLHSSVTFNNLLNSTASQMCQMQWR
ncbi:Uncharacterized protein GBIM_13913 [Gryllus bimaculatus]|nr:Uncharacterized protein GBIM_13913 [Gryllus bimaculatus]